MVGKKVYHTKLKKIFKVIYEKDGLVHLENSQIKILYVPITEVRESLELDIEDNNGKIAFLGDEIKFNCLGVQRTHQLSYSDNLFEDALISNNTFQRFDDGFEII